MNTIEELAQWVIDNRFTKSENKKVSDFEMFTIVVEKIKELQAKGEAEAELCKTCDWLELANKTSVCKKCGAACPF